MTSSLHRGARRRRLLSHPLTRLDVLELDLRCGGLDPRPRPSLTSARTPLTQRTSRFQMEVPQKNALAQLMRFGMRPMIFARPPIASPLQHYQNIAEPGSPPIVNFRNYPSSPPPTATFNLGSTTTPLHSSSHSRTISGGTPVSFGNLPQRTAPTAAPLLVDTL
jgi:hypothetical protein